MCISDRDIKEAIEREVAHIPNNWQVIPLSVDRNGAMVID